MGLIIINRINPDKSISVEIEDNHKEIRSVIAVIHPNKICPEHADAMFWANKIGNFVAEQVEELT